MKISIEYRKPRTKGEAGDLGRTYFYPRDCVRVFLNKPLHKTKRPVEFFKTLLHEFVHITLQRMQIEREREHVICEVLEDTMVSLLRRTR